MPGDEPRHTVLVVDDDRQVRDLLADGLHEQGVRVHAVGSGEEAIRTASSDPRICLVLADVRMPRMDGWDLERALRRELPDLPVVLLTADRLLSIRGSVRDKPMAPLEVLSLVRSRCAHARRTV